MEKTGAPKAVLDTKERSLNADSNKLLGSYAADVSSQAVPSPTNVLATIFEVWQEMHSYPCSFEKAVSGVHRRWRKFALGTPALWTSITRRPYQKNLRRISAHLDRSKPTSFHLVMSIGQPPTVDYDDYDEDHSSKFEPTPPPKSDPFGEGPVTFSPNAIYMWQQRMTAREHQSYGL